MVEPALRDENAMNTDTQTTPAAVFRLSHLGDIVLTTGVLEHWHRTRGMRFTFVTRSGAAPVLEGHPAIDQIITVDDDALGSLRGWLRFCGELAAKLGPIPLVDLHGTLRSRLLSLRWKGPVHRYPKFGFYRRLYARTRSDTFRKHLEATSVPQRYALACDHAPPRLDALLPLIRLTGSEVKKAHHTLKAVRNTCPLVALHPYATHPSKQWPEENWHTLMAMLDSAGINWFVVGRSDTPLVSGTRDFTNRTDLRETCALLAEADALITNDSGPMHLASAVSTPVVAFFGPTAKAWGFFPAGPRDVVLEKDMDCRPCSLHGGSGCAEGLECLASITSEAALKAVRTVLEK